MSSLAEGYEIRKKYKVTEQDTAVVVGSGGLSVLATPVLACWIEEGAYDLIQLNIDENQTSVGTKIDLNHISPTPINMKVTVNITVKEINNRKYTFSFVARDEVQEIANGIHERVIVDKEKFMNKVNSKNNG